MMKLVVVRRVSLMTVMMKMTLRKMLKLKMADYLVLMAQKLRTRPVKGSGKKRTQLTH